MSEKKANIVPINRKERRAQKRIEEKLEKKEKGAETVKVDVTRKIINIQDGQPVTLDGTTPTNLREISLLVLGLALKGDEESRAAKASRYYIAKKLQSGKIVELTKDDVAVLTDRIGRGIQQPFIVEPACLMLEGKE